ncbi:MAG: hypothetical protein WCS42_08605 [Verrucomicrobiota bacterium]
MNPVTQKSDCRYQANFTREFAGWNSSLSALRSCGCRQLALPPRDGINRWPNRFYDDYGKTAKLLLGPTDVMLTNTPATGGGSNNVADAASRSYLINGWNDYFYDHLVTADFDSYMAGTYPNGLKENAVVFPSDTIVLGEKS